MKYILLSHKLNENTPSYMASSSLLIFPRKQIKKGDSSNTFKIEMDNHIGTHADCQYHFLEEGLKLSNYNIEDFIFEKVEILEIKKDKGELIIKNDLIKYEELIKNKEFIIIKTDFQKYRDMDSKVYMFEGPGFSSEAARYLDNFENLKGIGFDFISFSSPLHREEGRNAHRIFLSKKRIIVEDMDLSKIKKGDKIKRLYVIPLFIDKIDSSPCTVFAEI